MKLLATAAAIAYTVVTAMLALLYTALGIWSWQVVWATLAAYAIAPLMMAATIGLCVLAERRGWM